MNIISLEVDGFKRIKAVRITPKGHVVEVSGDNGEGKSSTLDAIWAAFGGDGASPAKPIHTGEDKAEIRVLLGEGGEPKFKVTRRYGMKEGVPFTTDLKVEAADIGKVAKGQTLLNGIVGEMCFDPLGFIDQPDEAQIKALRQFVPEVDFAAIEKANKDDYEARTDFNRAAKSLRSQAEAVDVPLNVPKRVDVGALEKQLGEASKQNSYIAAESAHRDQVKRRREQLEAELDRLNEEKAGWVALPAAIDVEDVQTKLAAARQANAAAEKADQRKALEDQAEKAEKRSENLTTAIDKRKSDMAKAVQKAQMPVPGLGFGDGFVTLNGEPLSQASRAQQIRASVAIAAAMNPKLRIAIVKDGSLMDKKSWAALAEYAAEHDLQCWVETISPHSAAAILIEDGGTRTAEAEPAAADVGDVI